MTQQQYERIRLQGVAARQAGRSRADNPYANKPSLRRQADAWSAGWQAAHMRRQR